MHTQEELDRLHEAVPPDHYARGVQRNVFQWFWHTRRKAMARRIFRGLRGTRLLDLGCHGGYLTAFLARITNAETIGVDISAPAIFYATAHYPQIRFFQGDIQKPLPFSDASFDFITIFDVLEHVPDPRAVLREAYRLLAPNGSFIVGIALEQKPLFQLMWTVWRWSRGRVWNHVHVHKFSLRSFHGMMQDTGFHEEQLLSSHFRTYITVRFTKKV